MSTYTEKKAAERGKSFARQVWETIITAIVLAVAFAYMAFRLGMPK